LAGDDWSAFQSLIGQMAHEDDLLVSRTLWLILSQGLLLLAFFASRGMNSQDAPNARSRLPIAAIGFSSAVFIYSAILASEWEFIHLRTTARALTAAHPELPLRPLPAVGVGAGLLSPILLAILFLAAWPALIGARRAAVLAAGSAALFAVFVLGEAHEPAAGGVAATLLSASGVLAALSLALALAAGARSVLRGQP
jgi:hypothetical protein